VGDRLDAGFGRPRPCIPQTGDRSRPDLGHCVGNLHRRCGCGSCRSRGRSAGLRTQRRCGVRVGCTNVRRSERYSRVPRYPAAR
jgi:hypothetical protein